MLATPPLTDLPAIAPAPFSPPTPSAADLIWRLLEAGVTLTRLGRQATAKSLLDDTTALIETWYGEVAECGATSEARAGFISDLRMLLAWAEKAIRTVEIERMEQLTAARAHATAMAQAIDLECGF